MEILITGGLGYLGSYCAQYLKSKGNKITIVGRKIPTYMKEWAKDFNIILGDITDEKLIEKIPDEKYDFVIHFAAANEVKCRKEPKEAIIINTFGTKNILDICIKAHIKRFIYISTFHVYGNSNTDGVINEENNIKAFNLYGMTHYFGELLTKSYADNNKLICSSIRLANFCTKPLFKEIDRWSLVPNNFIMQSYENNEIIINSSGYQRRNFLSLKDLCSAIEIIIDKQERKYDVFNVGGDKDYSINEIAQLVKAIGEELITGKKIEIIHRKGFYENSENTGYIFDISKIKSMGYKPTVNIEEEIRDTFKQFIKSGGQNGK